jgi:hypothetical protein
LAVAKIGFCGVIKTEKLLSAVSLKPETPLPGLIATAEAEIVLC